MAHARTAHARTAPARRAQLPALLALAFVAAASLAPRGARACTTLLVGAGATQDGSLYLARTVDYDRQGGSLATNNLRLSPRRAAPAAFRSSVNKFAMDLPAPGLAYVAAPSSLVGRKPTMEEVGVNEAGVMVSTTQTIFSRGPALKADPLLPNRGLIEDVLASVLLPHPRATSARATVQLLGELIETYGSGEGFGVHVADARGEAWYLESAAGHRWLAQRLPRGSFFVSANQGRFQTFDIRDAANVLASPNLTDWAAGAGLWRPASGPLSFFSAFHWQTAADASANHPRVRALQQRLGCYSHSGPMGQAPPFLPPCAGRRLGLADVTGALRDHYVGTAKDPYMRQTPKAVLRGAANEPWRPVAHLTTGFAHVTRIRAGQPGPLRIVNYLYQGTPAWTPAVPVYPLAFAAAAGGAPAAALPPQLQGAVKGSPNGTSLFWKSRRLTALMFRDWPKIGPAVEKAVREFDARVEAVGRPAAEARWRALTAARKPEAAAAELAAFSRQVATDACALLDRLTADAVKSLGLAALPGDGKLLNWLAQATAAYRFNWR